MVGHDWRRFENDVMDWVMEEQVGMVWVMEGEQVERQNQTAGGQLVIFTLSTQTSKHISR